MFYKLDLNKGALKLKGMKKKNGVLFLALFLFSLPKAFAVSASPLAVSIFPPVQFPPESVTITGIRLDVLWGQHQNVYGIDLGAVGNITDHTFGGIQLAGGFNWNKGDATIIGLQGALANVNDQKTSLIGVQVGAYNHNSGESSLGGVGLGLVNRSDHMNIIGIQAGLYNSAKNVYGFQVGLFNSCDSLHGLQIGLVNMSAHALFSMAPILNIGF